MKKEVRDFVEYDYIEANQFLITIEYCSNCEEHQTHTQHDSDVYRNFAISLQKCILVRYPFIRTLLKPVDTNININPELASHIVGKSNIIDEKYKEVRIGALEVNIY